MHMSTYSHDTNQTLLTIVLALPYGAWTGTHSATSSPQAPTTAQRDSGPGHDRVTPAIWTTNGTSAKKRQRHAVPTTKPRPPDSESKRKKKRTKRTHYPTNNSRANPHSYPAYPVFRQRDPRSQMAQAPAVHNPSPSRTSPTAHRLHSESQAQTAQLHPWTQNELKPCLVAKCLNSRLQAQTAHHRLGLRQYQASSPRQGSRLRQASRRCRREAFLACMRRRHRRRQAEMAAA